MILTFNGIQYKHKAILWDYNPGSDSALCQLSVLEPEPDIIYSPDSIKNKLKTKGYEFINFESGAVVIANVSSMLNHFPMHPVPELNKAESPKLSRVRKEKTRSLSGGSPSSLTRKLQRTASSLSLFSGLSRSGSETHSDSSPETKRKTRKELVPETESDKAKVPVLESKNLQAQALYYKLVNHKERQDAKRQNYTSILIGQLILPDLDEAIWRQTLACKEKFIEVTEREKAQSIDWLRTATLVSRKLQLQQNELLYPIKTELVDTLERILIAFNKLFNQKHLELGIRHREVLYFYLRDAVSEAMSHSQFFEFPTEVETWPEDKRLEVFKGNKFGFEAHNMRYKRLRAEAAMIKILALMNPKISLSEVSKPISERNHRFLINLYLQIKPSYTTLTSMAKLKEADQQHFISIIQFIHGIEELSAEDAVFAKTLQNEEAEMVDINRISLKKLFDSEMQDCVAEGKKLLERYFHFLALQKFKEAILNENNAKLWSDTEQAITLIIGYDKALKESLAKSRKANRAYVDKQTVIDGFRSFQRLVTHYLQVTLKDEEGMLSEKIGNKATEAAIDLLNKQWTDLQIPDAKTPIPKSGYDHDFYVCQQWVEAINQKLSEIDLASLIKHPNRERYHNQFCEKVANALLEIYRDAINNYQPQGGLTL